jgi:tetratricopeptide (TPR) repeat protein
LVLFILAIWKLAKQYLSSNETDYFSLFIASAMVSWIVATLFNPVSVTNWLLASLLFAAALQTNNFYQLKYNALKVGGYALAAVLFLVGFSFILSEVFLWQSGRYSSDTQYYTSEYYANLAVDLNPTNLVALNQLAMTKYFNNDYDGSLQNLLRAERLHPLSAGVYQQSLTGYMNLYNKTNDEKFKVHVYEAAKKYETSYDNHQFVHQNLANLYFQLGDFDNALIQGRRWVVLSQGHYSAWLFMSQVYQALGKPELQAKAREDAFLAAPSKELRVKK